MQHSTLEEGAASRVQAIQEQRQVALLIVAEQQLVHQYLAQPNSISTQQRVMQLEPEQAKIDERQGIRGPKL